MDFWIGTAGWNIPKTATDLFPKLGSHLARYSSVLRGVEINSSFYRDHQAKTYARWCTTVPPDFRFSVKLHQRFTHEQKLDVDSVDLADSLSAILELGQKLGVLLVQLPPSLALDLPLAMRFFRLIRDHYAGPLACEPRHSSWTLREAHALFQDLRITKVRADPTPCPVPEPLDWENGFSYFRLHGSPEIYRSEYTPAFLGSLAPVIQKSEHPVWCIFDNTTFGHAWRNAVELSQLTETDGQGQRSLFGLSA